MSCRRDEPNIPIMPLLRCIIYRCYYTAGPSTAGSMQERKWQYSHSRSRCQKCPPREAALRSSCREDQQGFRKSSTTHATTMFKACGTGTA